MAALTVSQAVELAKAGVSLSYGDIKHDLVEDPSPQPHPYRNSPDGSGHFELMDLLRQRMKWNEFNREWGGPAIPAGYEFVAAHKLNNETVVIFAVVNGKSMILEDPWALYPSDALITQLRLLEK